MISKDVIDSMMARIGTLAVRRIRITKHAKESADGQQTLMGKADQMKRSAESFLMTMGKVAAAAPAEAAKRKKPAADAALLQVQMMAEKGQKRLRSKSSDPAQEPMSTVMAGKLEEMTAKMTAQTQMGEDLLAEKKKAFKVEIDDLTAKMDVIQTKVREMRKTNAAVGAKIRAKQQQVADAEGSGSSDDKRCEKAGKEHHESRTLVATLNITSTKVRTDYQKLLTSAKSNLKQAEAMRELFAKRAKKTELGRIFANAPDLSTEFKEAKHNAKEALTAAAEAAAKAAAANATNAGWEAKVRQGRA
jgi:hypothetical protein